MPDNNATDQEKQCPGAFLLFERAEERHKTVSNIKLKMVGRQR
jgi:hypothetical protein